MADLRSVSACPRVTLGVDVGSSSTKGALVTLDGRVVAVAERRHELRPLAPGRVEHDWREWWREFASVCRELLAARAVQLEAVSVSGLGPCLLPADGDGRPLRAAISYGVDTRATEQIAELYRDYPLSRIDELCGHALTSQSVGPKMLWLRDHEPDVWARTKTFFTSGSYLVHRLTGSYILDHTTASMYDPFYDARAHAWDQQWMRELAPDVRFPDLRWPDHVVGSVLPDVSRETGIPAGTPVTAGTMDFWAENIGCGAERPGECMIAYGTTMSVSAVTSTFISTTTLWSAPGSAADVNHVGGATSTAGALTDWMRQLTSTPDYATLLREAERVPAGSRGLLVLPYFSGERSPIHDPDARGVMVGLSLSHGRGEMYRAVLEAIALSVRHVLSVVDAAGVDVDRVVAVGGGVRGPLWAQIVCDVIGRPQQVPSVPLGAAYGDALVAARGAGVAQAGRWGHVEREIVPDPRTAAIYDELFALYRQLDHATRGISHTLSAASRPT